MNFHFGHFLNCLCLKNMSLLSKEQNMRSLKIMLIAATALCITNAAPTFAQSQGNGNGNGNGGGRAAPGPIAGMGLPFLIAAGAAGAYRLIRRRDDSHRQHDSVEQD